MGDNTQTQQSLQKHCSEIISEETPPYIYSTIWEQTFWSRVQWMRNTINAFVRSCYPQRFADFQSNLLLNAVTTSGSFWMEPLLTVHQTIPVLLCGAAALISAGHLGNGGGRNTLNEFTVVLKKILLPAVWPYSGEQIQRCSNTHVDFCLMTK